MCMCVFVYGCVYFSANAHGGPGTGVTGVSGLSKRRYWELDVGPLQEQYTLLTMEPFLWSLECSLWPPYCL